MSHSGYDRVIDNDIDTVPATAGSKAAAAADSTDDGALRFQSYHAAPDFSTSSTPQPRPNRPTSSGGGFGLKNPFGFLGSLDVVASRRFDITTDQVVARIAAAVNPAKADSFAELIRQGTLTGAPSAGADLYGPIWLSTTLVATLYMATTIAGYVAAISKDAKYTYAFDSLNTAAALVFGYTFGTAIALYLVIKLWVFQHQRNAFPSSTAGAEADEEPVGLFDAIAIYGYANSIYIPLTTIAATPVEVFPFGSAASLNTTANALRWACIIAAGGISAYFLYANIAKETLLGNARGEGIEKQRGQIVAGFAAVLHLGYMLAIKLLFFSHAHT